MGTLATPWHIRVWDETDPFGNWSAWRRAQGYGPHRGDDWQPGAGARIPASGAGRVVSVAWNSVLGWVIVVEYDKYRGVFFGYCHLESRPSRSPGSRFSLWDTIGYVGNTGTASAGAHLHLTASYSAGSPGTVAVINPMQFFDLSGTSGGDLTPIGGFLMALTDGEQKAVFDAISAIWSMLVENGVVREDGAKSFRDELIGTGTAARQTLAAVQSLTAAPAPVIDYDKLAAAIVDKLPPTALTKGDVVDALKSVSYTAN